MTGISQCTSFDSFSIINAPRSTRWKPFECKYTSGATKMMSKNVLFGMLLIQCRWAASQDVVTCTNDLLQEGTCRLIDDCEVLDRLYDKYGDNAIDFINKSYCPLELSKPILCCPNTDIVDLTDDNSGNEGGSLEVKLGQYRYGPLEPPVCGYIDSLPTKVVDGVPAKLGAWPWVALLGYRSNSGDPRWLCGGSLITARHILTAGHCVYRRKDLYIVRLGDLDISRNDEGAEPAEFQIHHRIVHPEYDHVIYTNDIAILRLHDDVKFTPFIKPICLPVAKYVQQLDLHSNPPYVVGWGAVYWNGPRSNVLLQFQPPPYDNARCKRNYANRGAIIDDRVLCAGKREGGQDACQGDSGGPMMVAIGKTWYSIGIISYGFRCALAGYPGVYTKTQSFLEFISKNLY